MNLWKLRTRLKRSIAGFTLIEMLVIVLIIGVLFAIASPGWEALLSRQRLGTAREQVVQALRQAQSTARSSRTAQIVVFRSNPTDKVPEIASGRYVAATPPTNWGRIGNGEIPANSVELTTNRKDITGLLKDAIIFDSNGALARIPEDNPKPPDPSKPQELYKVVVKRANTPGDGTNRCATITTLLGAINQAEGSDCN
jgi:Tfp pilus assembly protein FimT